MNMFKEAVMNKKQLRHKVFFNFLKDDGGKNEKAMDKNQWIGPDGMHSPSGDGFCCR